MNYQKLYDNLVSYRQSNPASGYTERHHILMRSMGGSNDPTNLVVLTGREHWIAHLLLHKIHQRSETAHACHMMAMRCEERGIPFVRNSRMYETIRRECAKLTSLRNSITHLGKGNSQYGTRWICNLKLQENRKILKNEVIPEGWVAGRNKWIPVKKKSRKPRESDGKTKSQQIYLKNRTGSYQIEDIMFHGIKSIASFYKISHPAVLYRINSPKFPHWKKARVS